MAKFWKQLNVLGWQQARLEAGAGAGIDWWEGPITVRWPDPGIRGDHLR